MYCIVFDLDGTLIDLPVDIEAAREEISAMFSQRGYHQPIRPILTAINEAAASVADSDEEIYPLILAARRILDAAEVKAAKDATLRPGVLEVLASLKRQGIPMGIVTNNSRACISKALEVLECSIQDFVISTRDDVRRPKPAPDGIVRIAPSLCEEGETLWFVGDSPVDVSAAVAANPQVAATVKAVAILGPRSTKVQLLAAGPCIVHASLAEAVDSIEKTAS